MNFPFNLNIGSVTIQAHLVFEMAAYFFGYRYYIYKRSKVQDKINDENRIIIFIAAAAGAVLFSRLVGFFDSSAPLDFSVSTIVRVYGNKTILGGLLGGLLAVEICKKVIKVKHSSGDLMTYPLFLAMIIGRIGCFLAGLEDGTYGIETDLPFGMNFGDGIMRHPTNLYEIVFLALLWLTISTSERKYDLAEGTKFKVFLSLYCVFRLLIEFIKPGEPILAGLTSIQIAALIGILYYYKVFLHPRSLIISSQYA